MAKKKYNDMSTKAVPDVAAPNLPYEPQFPRKYNPPIAVIGCGGITGAHFPAYKSMGLNVVAVCDIVPERAEARRKEFYPDAKVYTDYREVLKRDDVEVVDLATHPKDRAYLIPDALKAHKHVLSHKPFVLDLDLGERFVELADKMGVMLAVNQNGRWSPHWSWVRHAIAKGLVGDVNAVHLNCHWNHNWIANNHFNRVHHILIYDYGIHWFDAVSSFMPGQKAKRAFSTLSMSRGQDARPPLQSQTVIEFDAGHASILFDGSTQYAGSDTGIVVGSTGTLTYTGPDLSQHGVVFTNKKGRAQPKLEGTWFKQGFMGTMGALLKAIETKSVPPNNAVDNLSGLAICFASIVSAETGKPEIVGKIRKAPLKTCQVSAK